MKPVLSIQFRFGSTFEADLFSESAIQKIIETSQGSVGRDSNDPKQVRISSVEDLNSWRTLALAAGGSVDLPTPNRLLIENLPEIERQVKSLIETWKSFRALNTFSPDSRSDKFWSTVPEPNTVELIDRKIEALASVLKDPEKKIRPNVPECPFGAGFGQE